MSIQTGPIYADQVVSAIVLDEIQHEEKLFVDTVTRIQLEASEKMQAAQEALNESLGYVENVRAFVNDPTHILGAEATKHGEIAEHIEVEIGNARRVMDGLAPDRTFDNVGRTAPEDYLISGVKVQSKFINGGNKSLDAVLGHMRDYPDFTSGGGYYHIPKDQYETIEKVLSGQTDGINYRTITKCKAAVERIETTSGRSFRDVVRPGISKYDEVQLGRVDETLEQHEAVFKSEAAAKEREIQSERRNKEEVAGHITDATWGKAAKAGAISAIIQGSTMAGIKVYQKIHEGKSVSEFNVDDWKDIGYDFAKGGAKGGLSGISIYWLTAKNVMSAPFAGAVTSSAIGVADLYANYRSGKLDYNEFCDSTTALAVEAGLAAVGSAIGQAVIPIPIVGAVVGSAVSKAALEITKQVVGKKEKALILKMEESWNNAQQRADEAVKIWLKAMNDYYANLGGFIEAAMRKDSAARMYGSINLCKVLGVPDALTLHNINELNAFILSKS